MTEHNLPEQVANLKQILDAAGATYAIMAHATTVNTAEDGVLQGFGQLAEMAPTLILTTEKGLLAAIIPGGMRLAYKQIKRELGLKNVSLAAPDRVLAATGAEVGTVSMVNPGFTTIIDPRLAEVVYGGCGLPAYTLRIDRADLIRVTNATVFEFAETPPAS